MRIILVNPKKQVTVKEITEEYFDTKVYNNSGIQDPNIIGFMRIGKNEFYQIYVHPDHRQKGVGTILMDKIEALSKGKIKVHSGANEGEQFGNFLIKKGYIKEGKIWEKKI